MGRLFCVGHRGSCRSDSLPLVNIHPLLHWLVQSAKLELVKYEGLSPAGPGFMRLRL